MNYTRFHPRNLLQKSWWRCNSANWYGLVICATIWCTFLTFFPFAAGLVLATIALPMQAYYAARSHIAKHGYHAENNSRLLGILTMMTLISAVILTSGKALTEITLLERALLALSAFWATLFIKNNFVKVLAHNVYHQQVIEPAITRCKAGNSASQTG